MVLCRCCSCMGPMFDPRLLGCAVLPACCVKRGAISQLDVNDKGLFAAAARFNQHWDNHRAWGKGAGGG
jgi:hypothetical protein